MKTVSCKISALIIGAGLASTSVLAAPTVTFQGEVTSQTCSVSINGQTNAVVMLPTVSLSDFGGGQLTNGQTAGLTPFTVSVTGCTSTPNSQDISTKFLGYNVDSATGVLGNRATTSPATGFGIQLLDSASGGSPVVLNGPTDVPGLVLPANASETSYDYGAQYYVIDSTAAEAGAVTAVAEYTLSYF